ncbi:hypothetical protein AX17_005150 [Amanita inopinata Kibby_2008]|nr:hypothetical protein AX17_005150 [Amanita inopinata Kibby_2008]
MSSIVQHVPPEIVREIFDHFSTSLPVHVPKRFPWYLGHVCSSWRAVFSSMTTQFWSRIIIDRYRLGEWLHESPQCYERILDLMDFFLERNPDQPFSFKFLLHRYYRQEESFHVRRILDTLIQQSARWQDVFIILHESEIPTLYRVKDRLPLLRSLKLCIADDEEDEEFRTVPEPYTDVFKGAPLLRRVMLGSISTWSFDWHSLTVLELNSADHWDSDNLLAVLSQTTNLETLAVHQPFQGRIPSSSGRRRTPPIMLPCLKLLTIIGCGLLAILETPRLEQLSIDSAEASQSFHRIIRSFFHRSACRIQFLSMEDCEAEELRAILPYVPEVRHLHLQSRYNIGDAFKHLTVTGGMPPACHLQSLTVIAVPQLTERDIADLSTMIASRASQGPAVMDTAVPGNVAVAKLRHLSIYMWGEGVPNELETLRRQCEELGVRFAVHVHETGHSFWPAYGHIDDW